MAAPRKVRFDPHVAVRRLPVEELEAAAKARNGGWKEAPLDDELWDGDLSQFRPRELTQEELKRIVRAKRVQSLPKEIRKPISKVFKVLKKWGVLEGVDMVGAHARHVQLQDEDNSLAPPRLSRKVSGSLRSPTPLLAAPLEGDLEESCARYTQLCELAENLPQVRQEEVDADNALNLTKHDLAKYKQELRRLRNDIPTIEARLYRNANPRLLHYLQFDREEKVRRLQSELDALYAARNEAQSKVETLANLISEQTAKHELIKSELQRLVEAERDRRLIMESVLAVTAPTPELALLEASFAENTQQLAGEEGLLTSVRFTRDEIERSKDRLISALALLAEAGAMCFRPLTVGSSSGSLDSSPLRSRRASNKDSIHATSSSLLLQQRKRTDSLDDEAQLAAMRAALASRDEKINQAKDLAISAVDSMAKALNEFPPAARERIPAIYSSLMNQAIPELTSPELFGPLRRFQMSAEATSAIQFSMGDKPSGFGFGKAMHDKVQKKSEAVKKCKEIAAKHLDALRSAELAISARVRELKEKVMTKLAIDLAEEKRRAMTALCQRLALGAPVTTLPPPLVRQTSVSQVFPKIVPEVLDDSATAFSIESKPSSSSLVGSVGWATSKHGAVKASFAPDNEEEEEEEDGGGGDKAAEEIGNDDDQDADVEEDDEEETPAPLIRNTRATSEGVSDSDENTHVDESPLSKPVAGRTMFEESTSVVSEVISP